MSTKQRHYGAGKITDLVGSKEWIKIIMFCQRPYSGVVQVNAVIGIR
jgi:hypothetical protein